MPKKPIEIEGKFQCKKGDFGFVIPEDRAEWGGDFFIHKKHFLGAIDGERVVIEPLERNSGKKPEARIIRLMRNEEKKSHKKQRVIKNIEGIFSGGNGDFGFIDVAGEEEGYFVYGLKKNGAKDGDRVVAEVKKYNGKNEAIVTDILPSLSKTIHGVFTDLENFGFVRVEGDSQDIFIAGSRKAEAKTGDKVEVEIIKTGGRRAEGIIKKVL